MRFLKRAVPAVGLIVLGACSTYAVDLSRAAPATWPEEPGGFESAVVSRVVDGDTIEVEILSVQGGPGAGDVLVGSVYDVRLLGIDTPESVKPGTPVECFGREASAATKALLNGAEVRLVKDVEERDRYDRLLRYVYLSDELANARLILNGYALTYTYPPNVRWSQLLVQLEREAREGDRGLWSPSTCSGDT